MSINLFFIRIEIKLKKKLIIYYILYLYKIYPRNLFSINFNIKRQINSVNLLFTYIHICIIYIFTYIYVIYFILHIKVSNKT